MTCWLALAAPSVDQAAKGFEYPGNAVDLVEDHESIFVLCQVEFRFRQFGSVRWQFEV